MHTFRIVRTALTLEKPWFPVASRWIDLETVTGAIAAEKASKAAFYQLTET